jgi:hypothetical protein
VEITMQVSLTSKWIAINENSRLTEFKCRTRRF